MGSRRSRRFLFFLLLVPALAGCALGGAKPVTKPSPTRTTQSGSQGIYPQDVTVSGFFSGHLSSGYGYCIKTGEGFQGYVQDVKPGSALRFDFKIPLSSYHGAGSYGPHEGNTPLGTVYMAGQVTWTAAAGTFTVDRGEKTGSIQMHLTAGSFKPEDIAGHWRCG
jgi:hypothetical protein